MNPNPLGLYRLMTYEQRQDVERELSVSFADLYDALDDAHHEARELEELLNGIFRGQKSE